MPSSVAAQLALEQSKQPSLDQQRLSKHQASFVFTPRYAAALSLADLHHLAQSAYDNLLSLDSAFQQGQSRLFGNEALATDRTTLTQEQNSKLDKTIAHVLRNLSKYILLKPSGLVIEWLVRRFRINDINIHSLVATFLPYHSTPHFASCLQLIPDQVLLAHPFLSSFIPAKQSLQPVQLSAIIALLPPFSAVPSARALLDFLLRLPLQYLEQQPEETVHRPLVSFWLQLVAGYLERAGPNSLKEGERTAVLSAILDVLRLARSQPDLLVACYILLARYALFHPLSSSSSINQSSSISPEDGEEERSTELEIVTKTIVTHTANKAVRDKETDEAFLTCLVVLSQLSQTEEGVVAEGEGMTVGKKEGKKMFGTAGYKAILRVENLGELLVKLCNTYDAERFMKPFTATVGREALKHGDSLSLLNSLVTPRSTTLPTRIISLVASSSLTALLSLPAEPRVAEFNNIPGVIKVLNQIYQRWPQVWEAESRARSEWVDKQADEESKRKLWKIVNQVLGLDVTTTTSTASSETGETSNNLALSTSSPDLSIRVSALRELVAHASTLATSNPQFLHDALVARLSEPVLEIHTFLLENEQTRNQVLHQSLTKEEILETLKKVLEGVEKNRTTREVDQVRLVGVVLGYLLGSFVVSFPDLVDRVVREIIWDRLLVRKGTPFLRVAMARAWAKADGSVKQHAWVRGIGEVLNKEEGSEKDLILDQGVEMNRNIVHVLAKNLAGVLGRTDLENGAVTGITSFIFDSSPTAKSLLSTLVGIQLFPLLPSSVLRSTLLSRLLLNLHLSQTGLDGLAQGAEIESLLTFNKEDVALSPLLAQAVFTRSNNPKTGRRAKAALFLSGVAALRPVPSSEWMWLASPSSSPSEGSLVEHLNLVKKLYKLAHSGTTPASTGLGKEVLGHLLSKTVKGPEVLAFLASIWTDTHSSSSSIPMLALQDAQEFIRVYSTARKGVSVDFQTIVPALLVAVFEGDKDVRNAALETVKVVAEFLPKGQSVSDVWGHGKLYGVGARSEDVQYLDIADTTKYVNKLLESRLELTTAGSYLATLHSNTLQLGEPEGVKKKNSLRLKVYTFLLSHVAAWTDRTTRTTLLKSLEGIQDSGKNSIVVEQLLAPVVKILEKDKEVILVAERENEENAKEYARLLLQPYKVASRKWLEADEGQSMRVFVSAIGLDQKSELGAALRKEALAIISTYLFATLRGDARFSLFKRLIKLATNAESYIILDVLSTLQACQVDGETFTTYLNDVKSSLATPVSKGAKRGRVSIDATSRYDRLPELIVALESTDIKDVSVSHGLLLTLFDLLSSLLENASSAQVDIQYLGQLLLSALSKAVKNITSSSGITSDSIRMAPVLDFMRSSTNPQTAQQSLLLLAKLGPLVPDQLVHNVMPIFTFMGANVLQRDDAYSLRVVEQTLESIVPSLVKSLKKSARSREALLKELRELLTVFTAAAAHVPRHRRLKLFVRFVETLGPREFLSTVSVLLLTGSQSASADLAALPPSLFEEFSVPTQLNAIQQMVEEVSKLVQSDEGHGDRSIAISGSDGGDSDDNAVKLALFAAETLQSKQLAAGVDSARALDENTDVDTMLTELVRSLLDLSGSAVDSQSALDSEELEAAAAEGVQGAVRLMSTRAFSEAVLWLLDLSDSSIQTNALVLLRTRLPLIKPSRRADISPAVISVVERIHAALVKPGTDLEQMAQTLDVVAASTFAEEDAVLSKAVPDLIQAASATGTSGAARLAITEVVRKLSTRLGPRLIPLLAKIVPFAVSTAQQEGAEVSLVETAFRVLEGVFTSVPTFVGGQLDKVFQATLSPAILSAPQDGPVSKSKAALMSTIAKKLPAKALYPAIVRLFGSQSGDDSVATLGLLDLLNRALRFGKPEEVMEHYKPVFKLFLRVFDVRRTQDLALSVEDISSIEDNALGAFVQFILKLNEQTFRPLFLRTYDWAAIDLADDDNASSGLVARRTVMYKLVDRLLSQLKSIVVPYYSFMIEQTTELFTSFAAGDLEDQDLWSAMVSSLTKALESDENGFWTPARLAKLSKQIASQVFTTSSLSPASTAQSEFASLVSAYSEALLPHESLLKSFNMSLLMLTRSDDLRVKRGALEALEKTWETLGDGMLGLVPETTPFLAETLEETDGGVETTTRKLIKRIESHLGEELEF
ncbi:hypothetical protein T439DRAFT_308506 [Meredithblackwellia eburnea MCA 4105]